MAQRRPRLGAEFWKQVLQRLELSGLRPGEFCAQEGLSDATLRRWRTRLRPFMRTSFVELVPETEPSVVPDLTPTSPPPDPVAAWTLEIELPTGVTIRYRG